MFNKYFILIITSFSFLFSNLNIPENGAQLSYIHILFEWDQEPSAIAYELQVSNQQSFNNIILDIEEATTSFLDTDSFNWNSTYYWRLRSIFDDGNYGNWSDISTFSTGNTALTNLTVDFYNEELLEEGLLMYSQFSPYFAVGVIDKFGNEIWNGEDTYMNHITPYGQLYGSNGQAVQFNFNHEILWSSPEGTDIDAHEAKQTQNGNYMALVPTFESGPVPNGDWTNYFQIIGYQADGVTNEFPWMGIRLVEFDQETSQEVWSWEPFEHFSMNDYDIYQGMWWQAAFSGFFDWMHTNAFHFDEEESVIYLSHRHLSRISKISYPSGEVIWNMGLPAEYNTGSDNICEDLLFSFQHHIQLMDDGTLLFFDNGNISDILTDDETPITRIRRIRVIDDNYCETIWQYDLPSNLHGMGMGSVQLLDNGNYSIYTFGSGLNNGEPSIIEVTNEGEMIWKATSQNSNAAWYRSYKIPSIYPYAFSVIADNYVVDENSNDVIQIDDNSLEFTIHNKSGYYQTYNYIFSDQLDGGPQMFLYSEGELNLEPDESMELSFLTNNNSLESSVVLLSIWPTFHEYHLKQLFFDVNLLNVLMGDVNYDGEINVLDVVVLVNIVLGSSGEVVNADLNNDGLINVIDIVLLVNLILQ